MKRLVCAHTSSAGGFGSGPNICASWRAVEKLGGGLKNIGEEFQKKNAGVLNPTIKVTDSSIKRTPNHSRRNQAASLKLFHKNESCQVNYWGLLFSNYTFWKFIYLINSSCNWLYGSLIKEVIRVTNQMLSHGVERCGKTKQNTHARTHACMHTTRDNRWSMKLCDVTRTEFYWSIQWGQQSITDKLVLLIKTERCS